MSQPPFPLWTDSGKDAAFTDPAEIARRSNRFALRVRLRNAIEYAAGAVVLVPATIAAIASLWVGEWAFALALGALAAGILVVLVNLHRRAGHVEAHPEEPCRDHLERQYRRQYEALKSVPAWYIAPFVPGIALIYGVVTVKMAEAVGWSRALEGVALPVIVTIVAGGAIIALNLWSARQLKRRLAALKALS